MFVGYARNSSQDTYRMYVPELNSVHETRDVQWAKRMFYEPEKAESVHAVDSVDLIVNKQSVPLRTVSKVIPVAIPRTDKEKMKVKFEDDVDVIPAEQEDESKTVEREREDQSKAVEKEREDESEPGRQDDYGDEDEEQEVRKEARWMDPRPEIIEIEPHQDEEMSTLQ